MSRSRARAPLGPLIPRARGKRAGLALRLILLRHRRRLGASPSRRRAYLGGTAPFYACAGCLAKRACGTQIYLQLLPGVTTARHYPGELMRELASPARTVTPLGCGAVAPGLRRQPDRPGIPCHRVIAATAPCVATLGPLSGKKALLEREAGRHRT